MNRIKKGKAIGKDEIAVEMLESLGEKGLEIIKDIANKIYNTGILPEKNDRNSDDNNTKSNRNT